MAYSKRQASDWNYVSLRGCHATAVGELYVDGIGIGMNVVARAAGLEKMAVISCVGYFMLTRGKVWRGGPQNCIIK